MKDTSMSANNDDAATLNEKLQVATVGNSSYENVQKKEEDITNQNRGEDVEKNLNGATKAQEKLPEVTPASRNDGGLWGWLAVLGSWLIQFTGFGYANAFGVYQDYYTRIYLSNFSTSTISWIGSTQLFLQLSSGIVAGRLFDRGYFYSVVIIGSILYVFSLFMLSLAKPQQYYQIFLSQAIGGGIGSGLAYVPSVAILAQHFTDPHRRALVMAIIASGSSFGGVIHPIMLNNLINGHVGFANGVRASAGLLGGCLLIAIAVMRTKPHEKAVRKQVLPMWEGLKKFSKEPAYLLFIFAMFIFSMGLFYPIFYIQLDAVKHGVDSNFAFYSLSILNALSMVGRLVPGFLSRRVGVFNMIGVTTFCCAAVIFGMFGLHDRGSVAAIGVFFGLFSGAYVTLLAPMLTMFAEHPTEIGSRVGIAFACQGLGGLIGTPIIGALLTGNFLWWRGTIYAGTLCGVSSVIFLLSRLEFKKRRKVAGWIL